MSEAEDRARSAGWEVGNADRINGIVPSDPDGTIVVDVNEADLQKWSGVCSPYDDPDEHYGTMQQAVLDAHDVLMDVLFDAYCAGYREGASNTD